MAYLNQHPLVLDYVERVELRFFIDQCYADAYVRMGMLDSAGFYFSRAEQQTVSRGGPHARASLYDDMGYFYRKKSDMQRAVLYYQKEETIGKETGNLKLMENEADLLKLEVDNNNARRDREAREEELAREHRHNVQYMGFTVRLVVLFIVLVMMGWLAVPPSVIRTLGFLSLSFFSNLLSCWRISRSRDGRMRSRGRCC